MLEKPALGSSKGDNQLKRRKSFRLTFAPALHASRKPGDIPSDAVNSARELYDSLRSLLSFCAVTLVPASFVSLNWTMLGSGERERAASGGMFRYGVDMAMCVPISTTE